MDKAISVEERIRRAEEIYKRRNNGYINTSNMKKEKSKKKGAKKLFMQIFMCLTIYLAFYIFNNRDYIFSENFLNQIRGLFSSNSKIYETYEDIKNIIHKHILTNKEQIVENTIENEILEEQTNTQNEDNNIDNQEEGIGGAKKVPEENKNSKQKEKSQMEKDAEYIKKKIDFNIPVKGTISSTFGWRNPTTSTVPKYHTGLDIATTEGTIIKSATDGKVILASFEGDYGKHYKIQNGDVIIIYAHCSKLYLKEGTKVKKGEKIAEVGSTGNSTGPHLHFEIRIEDRLVDPQLILDI